MKECGCTISYHEEIESEDIYETSCPEYIKFCPLHNAAPDMYEVGKELIEYLGYMSPGYLSEHVMEYMEKLEKALAKAEGK